MSDPLSLTLQQQFQIEAMNRTIDGCGSVDELRRLAKQLLQAWHVQKAAVEFAARQALAVPHEHALAAARAAEQEKARAASKQLGPGQSSPA